MVVIITADVCALEILTSDLLAVAAAALESGQFTAVDRLPAALVAAAVVAKALVSGVGRLGPHMRIVLLITSCDVHTQTF